MRILTQSNTLLGEGQQVEGLPQVTPTHLRENSTRKDEGQHINQDRDQDGNVSHEIHVETDISKMDSSD